jgi:DnaK suppressor protein
VGLVILYSICCEKMVASKKIFDGHHKTCKAAMTDTANIEHFRIELARKREDILALGDARKQSSATVVLDQSSVGRLSRMDALQQQAMAQDSQRRAAATLVRIEAALRRCDDGSYGVCIDCEEAIALKRLEFDPTALRCVHCAQAQGQ